MLRGIRIGELDRKVTIQQKSVTRDDLTNEESSSWVTVKSVFAKRMGPKSMEKFEANQQVALTEARYFMRYQSGLDDTMILIDGGEMYHIKGIEQDLGRKQSTILTVEKRDNVALITSDLTTLTADDTSNTSDLKYA